MRSHNDEGATAVEFTLVCFAFLLLLIVTLETGWQAATEIALEHGAHDAIRFAITGESSVPGLTDAPSCGRTATIEWLVTRSSPGLLSPSNLSLTTSIDTNGAFAKPIGPAAAGFGGGSSDTVLFTFSYQQPWLTPLAALIVGNSSYQHVVTLLAQNEAFSQPACA